MAAKKTATKKKAAPKKTAKKVAKKAAPKKAAKRAAPKKAPAKKAAPAKKPAAKKAPAKKAAPKKAAPKPAGGPGRFVWHEIATANPAAAVSFYTQLLGWKTSEMDMGPGGKYTMFHVGENAIGGIQPLEAGDPTPTHWHGYCTVDNVDAAVVKAQATGGKVIVPPMDIPTVGRFAVVADPQGAMFLPFSESNPMPPPPMTPGVFCWDELLTSDPAAAASFYTGIFGWGVRAMEMGAMGTYRVLLRGDQMSGGIMGLPMPGVPPHWNTHIAVANVDASAKRAESLGAKIVVPPSDVPGQGRFALVMDPAGATFSIFQGNAPSA